MATRVGINGFGRIGRQVLKALRERYPGQFNIVGVNDITDAKTLGHLFKYDSNYGVYPGTVEVGSDHLVIDGDEIRVFAERDPVNLPWGDLGAEIIVESTGLFTERAKAARHLEAGAQKVIVSAPAKGPDLTVVLGVNEDMYDSATHHVVSNASCTTNCLAPVARVLFEEFGIVKGLMTTIHAYTNDQRILDLPHKDLRRARAAALNIIPTSTGAARAVALVIPELEGKFDGYALRVPTSTVSIVDFVVQLEREATAQEVNDAFRKWAGGRMKGILDVTDEPLVSMDLKGNPYSSIVDAQLTNVVGDMVKVVSWYDNEWGYSCRTADLARYMGERL